MFVVSGANDKIHNSLDLISYLVSNQGKEIRLKIVPEAICLRNLGLYDILDLFEFSEVHIYTNNPLEKHNKYAIHYTKVFKWFEFNTLPPGDNHVWTLAKIFLCMYGRPTASRLGLSSYLNSSYKNQTLLHFSSDVSHDSLIHYEFDKLSLYRKNSIREVGEMIESMPILLSSPENYSSTNGYDYSDTLTELYRDIFVDVVSESHVSGNTFFVTEKTVRPMLLKKPFIVFASKDYLCYLRQMGFRTFGDFWDEKYDGYEGTDRFLRMIELIDWIASKTLTELEQMYYDMQYSLQHNYELVTSKKFNTEIRQII